MNWASTNTSKQNSMSNYVEELFQNFGYQESVEWNGTLEWNTGMG